MKPRVKSPRTNRLAKGAPQGSGAFVVPSHGRLARRGSTEVVEEGAPGRRGLREPPTEAS